MILQDEELVDLMKAGYLPDDIWIGPSSVDLRLGDSFLRPKPFRSGPNSFYYTQRLDQPMQYRRVDKQNYLIKPSEFVLATTVEKVRVPQDCAALVAGRSSIGRLGLQVQNAGFIDAGFEGQITLELSNQTFYSIELVSGMRICQLVFYQMKARARHPYSGKYMHQVGPVGSRMHQEITDEFLKSIRKQYN